MRLPVTIVGLVFLVIACDSSTSSDPAPLQLTEITYGGCAGIFSMAVPELDPATVVPHVIDEGPDTLIVEWEDSLQIFLGLNYICCAPFIAEHQIVQDTLVLAVRDTCPPPYTTCYCWCYCYYTFTWKFVDGEEEVHHLRVELVDPRADTVAVLYREQLEHP